MDQPNYLTQSNILFVSRTLRQPRSRAATALPASVGPIAHRLRWMTPLSLTLALLLTISAANAADKPAPSVVELPRPNSGTFSFQQAEARKSEILSNAPTPRLENWKNPFMGFCVHIGKDDSLTVYGHFMKGLPEYSKPRTGQSVADIKRLTVELPLGGNPAGVLITSEVPLKDSKVIHELLKVLFVPSVQVFYVGSTEPDGAANETRPVGSKVNPPPPPPPAGSGR